MKRIYKLFILILLNSLFAPIIFNSFVISETHALNNDVVSESNYNIVRHNCLANEDSFIYFNDSIWPAFESESNSLRTVVDPDTWYEVEDTTVNPYCWTCALSSYRNPSSLIGSAFLFGPNVAMTAGHCIENGLNFKSNLYVMPGFDEFNQPYGSYKVTDIIVQKEFYIAWQNNGAIDNYDWAILILEEDTCLGNFGKIACFSELNSEVFALGYPGASHPNDMWLSTGRTIYNSEIDPNYKIEYTNNSEGGNSGGPVYVIRDGHHYIVAVNTSSGSASNGGVKISSFIFRLTNSLIEKKGVVIRNHYFDGVDEIKYNCVIKYIIDPIIPGRTVFLSTDGVSFSDSFDEYTEIFYPTKTNSLMGDYEYDFFRTYDEADEYFSPIYCVSSTYNSMDYNGLYMTRGHSNSSTIISTSYGSASWPHLSSFEHVIKGTIVYNGIARNIETPITNSVNLYTEAFIDINNVRFTIRANRGTISIKSSVSVQCNLINTMFAFGIY